MFGDQLEAELNFMLGMRCDTFFKINAVQVTRWLHHFSYQWLPGLGLELQIKRWPGLRSVRLIA